MRLRIVCELVFEQCSGPTPRHRWVATAASHVIGDGERHAEYSADRKAGRCQRDRVLGSSRLTWFDSRTTAQATRSDRKLLAWTANGSQLKGQCRHCAPDLLCSTGLQNGVRRRAEISRSHAGFQHLLGSAHRVRDTSRDRSCKRLQDQCPAQQAEKEPGPFLQRHPPPVRRKVDALPVCLAPVSTTTGRVFAERFRRGSTARGIHICKIYDITAHCAGIRVAEVEGDKRMFWEQAVSTPVCSNAP